MNYCPECGSKLVFGMLEQDIPADYYYYHCSQGHDWVETREKGGSLVYIAKQLEKEKERR